MSKYSITFFLILSLGLILGVGLVFFLENICIMPYNQKIGMKLPY